MVWAFPSLVAALYFSLLLLLYIFQEGFIFPGANSNHLAYQQYSHLSSNRVTNGVDIQGWCISSNQTKANSVVLYFGGNGQDNVLVLDTLQGIAASKIYTFNYRGYGLSEGSPSEANLYSDAISLFDSIIAENKDTQIIIMGQSLGSAIAGYVASQRTIDKLILISPISSMKKIAQERFHVWVPNILVKHNFNLIQNAQKIQVETLVLVGTEDKIVSNKQSKLTFGALEGKKTWVEIFKAGHNDIFGFNETMESINLFIGGISHKKEKRPQKCGP